MRTVLVTGSDTGVGKTHGVAALASALLGRSKTVQIVKVVETGQGTDAANALKLCGGGAESFTLVSLPQGLSPPASAAIAGFKLSIEDLVQRIRALPPCDWRILEGAGGIATPVDSTHRDWADFAVLAGVDAAIVVVPDRLGAINQARLAYARAKETELPAGIWLNEAQPAKKELALSNREGLAGAGIPLWAEQPHGQVSFLAHEGMHDLLAENSAALRPGPGSDPFERWKHALGLRREKGLLRTLRVNSRTDKALNLADNDYLELAMDPFLAKAIADEVAREGTSASASPLITGWRPVHETLIRELCAWHGMSCGLAWTSGYAANSAVLGNLPRGGDRVFADRLIHNSMVSGLLRSGARLQRYAHLNLDQLEAMLGEAGDHPSFVVTETLFSMDGDFPDLARMAALKRRFNFFWILDEAHALGWYGPQGSGLARQAGVQAEVDVLVGTLGKTMASGGAYTLFKSETVRDYLLNEAGEFIYSTALPPANAAAALAALERIRALAPEQPTWHAMSSSFRAALRAEGWATPAGNSPIVPVRLDDPQAAVSLAEFLRQSGILTAAVRPPTVPAGTSRLRFSLKRSFGPKEVRRVLEQMDLWRRR